MWARLNFFRVVDLELLLATYRGPDKSLTHYESRIVASAKFPSVPIFLVCVPISLNSLNVQNSAILGNFDHF